MYQFPSELEKILVFHIKKNYLPKRAPKGNGPLTLQDLKVFSRGAKILSRAFTGERSSLPPNYFNDPVLRSGYLLYFLPVNFLKVSRVLSEFSTDELVSGKVRILDAGSGPGTAMLSLMHFYAGLLGSRKVGEAWLDFTLIDRNFSILKDAKSLHDLYLPALRARLPSFDSVCSTKNFDLNRGGIGRFLRGFRFHLIVVENLLNEFPDKARRVDFIGTLIRDHLEPGKGKIVIVEPASRKTSRDLQALRDELVFEKKEAFVHAPCLHQGPCPLNVANGRDWCHFYFDWESPAFIDKVDRLIGNRKEFLACSYLVLAREPRHKQPTPETLWRVISNPLLSKGKGEFILCGRPGRYRVARLDRDKAAKNSKFETIRRGDLVSIDVGGEGKPYTVNGSYRIEKEDPVSVIKRL